MTKAQRKIINSLNIPENFCGNAMLHIHGMVMYFDPINFDRDEYNDSQDQHILYFKKDGSMFVKDFTGYFTNSYWDEQRCSLKEAKAFVKKYYTLRNFK